MKSENSERGQWPIFPTRAWPAAVEPPSPTATRPQVYRDSAGGGGGEWLGIQTPPAAAEPGADADAGQSLRWISVTL